jgi:hypothetical protein
MLGRGCNHFQLKASSSPHGDEYGPESFEVVDGSSYPRVSGTTDKVGPHFSMVIILIYPFLGIPTSAWQLT